MVPFAKTTALLVGGVAVLMTAVSDTVLRVMPDSSRESVSFMIGGLTFLGGLIVSLFMLGRRYQAFADSNNALAKEFADLNTRMANIGAKVDNIEKAQQDMFVSLVEAGILTRDGKSRVDPDSRWNR